MGIKLVLPRLRDDGIETLGRLLVIKDEVIIAGTFTTLEPPWKDNQHDISCIPANTPDNPFYIVDFYNSPTKGRVLLIQHVPDRDMAELHIGNFVRNTKGCILIGKEFVNVDCDGELDISDSRPALNELMGFITGATKLYIFNAFSA